MQWFEDNNAINKSDGVKFKELTDMRNSLAHNMTTMLMEGFPGNIFELYISMIQLFEKIEKWWICEIELPTDPEITEKMYDSINRDEVTSLNLEFIKVMSDIAINNNEKYLSLLQSTKPM
ncbi:MAG: hypothetical protein LBD23_08735 [Oscillospiraceae bacterium]|nr:hypothetical protein [Oscillospiraceae bacterium]